MNTFFTAIKPYTIYLKLAIIALLVGGAAYFSWDYRGAKVQQEVDEAVGDATREINRAYSLERERRQALERAIDTRYSVLLDKLENIKTGTTIINQTIRQDIKANPDFYNQPLPALGYEQWQKARSLVSSPSPSSAAAPSPLSPSPTTPSRTPSLPSKQSGLSGSSPAQSLAPLSPLTTLEISSSTTPTQFQSEPPASSDTTASSSSLDQWLNANGYAPTSTPTRQPSQSEAESPVQVGVVAIPVATNLNPWHTATKEFFMSKPIGPKGLARITDDDKNNRTLTFVGAASAAKIVGLDPNKSYGIFVVGAGPSDVTVAVSADSKEAAQAGTARFAAPKTYNGLPAAGGFLGAVAKGANTLRVTHVKNGSGTDDAQAIASLGGRLQVRVVEGIANADTGFGAYTPVASS